MFWPTTRMWYCRMHTWSWIYTKVTPHMLICVCVCVCVCMCVCVCVRARTHKSLRTWDFNVHMTKGISHFPSLGLLRYMVLNLWECNICRILHIWSQQIHENEIYVACIIGIECMWTQHMSCVYLSQIYENEIYICCMHIWSWNYEQMICFSMRMLEGNCTYFH